MNRQEIIENCEKDLSYVFDNKDLLISALTHSSSAETHLASNERMEFLGDAVLGYVICDMLYQIFPENNEGDLTKVKSAVVSRDCCYRIAEKLNLEQYLITGRGFGKHQRFPASLLSNAVEAVIAAIYLDGGMNAARKFIKKNFKPEIENLSTDIGAENYKSLLQHLGQKHFNIIPKYLLLDEKGPDHCKCFKMEVAIGPKHFTAAWGNTKKEAEQHAAENAICQLEGKEPPYSAGDDF
ncbi:MAG: ribonuclease III [Planctomycetaceae bacterium]|jgi:ribonuclease-3|nr:ribonuclease III [Planctomycetaceae bacterium]